MIDSPQQEWILPQKQLTELNEYFNNHKDDLIRIAWKNMRDQIHLHLCACHSSDQSERDMLKEKYRQLMAASGGLLLIAHDEWEHREKRKQLHDEISWVSGWISGYLTSKKFVNDRIKELRQSNQEYKS